MGIVHRSFLHAYTCRSLDDALKSVFDNVHMQAELIAAQEQLVSATRCNRLVFAACASWCCYSPSNLSVLCINLTSHVLLVHMHHDHPSQLEKKVFTGVIIHFKSTAQASKPASSPGNGNLQLAWALTDMAIRNAQQAAMEDAADSRREIQDEVEQQEALARGGNSPLAVSTMPQRLALVTMRGRRGQPLGFVLQTCCFSVEHLHDQSWHTTTLAHFGSHSIGKVGLCEAQTAPPLLVLLVAEAEARIERAQEETSVIRAEITRLREEEAELTKANHLAQQQLFQQSSFAPSLQQQP
eukprot:582286-Pelagomonas_calceolata.AAC.1